MLKRTGRSAIAVLCVSGMVTSLVGCAGGNAQTANSFSCGNLVPNVFKNSHNVTIIGQTSGGGSCMVLPATTAYGCNFQISGPMRLAFIKNGSFYDIDQGAEPDVYIDDPKHFYDRKKLTEFINGIY